MDYTISQTAIDTEESCAGLQLFVDNLPGENDLTDGLEDLVAVSQYLRDLDRDYPHFARSSQKLQQDVILLLRSLNLTLDKLKAMFRQTRYRRPNGNRPYRRAWDDVCMEFKQQERGPGFGARAETYSMFLKGILDSCRGVLQTGEMSYHRQWIVRCLERQSSVEPELTQSFATLSFGGPPANFPRLPSFPPIPQMPPMPPFNTLPYPSGPSSPISDEWYPQRFRPSIIPPAVPDPPNLFAGSPTPSGSTVSTNYTQSSTSSIPPAPRQGHWASSIFDGKHPSTRCRAPGAQTACYGRPELDLVNKLKKESFVEISRLTFESANVTARFYWRADNHRARILLTATDAGGRPVRLCLPLSALKLSRKGTCVQLHRFDQETNRLQCWANLRFDIYERLVLFYCVFTALKSQDPRPHPALLQDYFQGEEEEVFAGQIEDSRFLHALRLFADKDSGGLRLEAKARRGPMQRTPIWTAFCTKEVMAPDFVVPVGSKTVLVRRVRLYVFCDGFMPLEGSRNGQVLLKFSSPADARNFVEVAQYLREERR